MLCGLTSGWVVSLAASYRVLMGRGRVSRVKRSVVRP